LIGNSLDRGEDCVLWSLLVSTILGDFGKRRQETGRQSPRPGHGISVDKEQLGAHVYVLSYCTQYHVSGKGGGPVFLGGDASAAGRRPPARPVGEQDGDLASGPEKTVFPTSPPQAASSGK
jgi:hypothetical protein